MGSSFVTSSSGDKVYAEKHDDRTSDVVPIVFIHGLTGTSKSFQPILSYLDHRTCILIDLPGRGSSPPSSASLTPSSLARIVHDVLSHYGYHTADVVAHSGGSLVGLQFAYDYSKEIRKLVLLAPPTPPLPKDAMLANANIVRAEGLETMFGVIKMWISQRIQSDPESESEVLKTLREEMSAGDGEDVAKIFEALVQFEFKPVPSETQLDVVIIIGAEDPTGTKSGYAALADLIRGEVVEVDTGHFFAIENPSLTGNAIRRALSY